MAMKNKPGGCCCDVSGEFFVIETNFQPGGGGVEGGYLSGFDLYNIQPTLVGVNNPNPAYLLEKDEWNSIAKSQANPLDNSFLAVSGVLQAIYSGEPKVYAKTLSNYAKPEPLKIKEWVENPDTLSAAGWYFNKTQRNGSDRIKVDAIPPEDHGNYPDPNNIPISATDCYVEVRFTVPGNVEEIDKPKRLDIYVGVDIVTEVRFVRIQVITPDSTKYTADFDLAEFLYYWPLPSGPLPGGSILNARIADTRLNSDAVSDLSRDWANIHADMPGSGAPGNYTVRIYAVSAVQQSQNIYTGQENDGFKLTHISVTGSQPTAVDGYSDGFDYREPDGLMTLRDGLYVEHTDLDSREHEIDLTNIQFVPDTPPTGYLVEAKIELRPELGRMTGSNFPSSILPYETRSHVIGAPDGVVLSGQDIYLDASGVPHAAGAITLSSGEDWGYTYDVGTGDPLATLEVGSIEEEVLRAGECHWRNKGFNYKTESSSAIWGTPTLYHSAGGSSYYYREYLPQNSPASAEPRIVGWGNRGWPKCLAVIDPQADPPQMPPIQTTGGNINTQTWWQSVTQKFAVTLGDAFAEETTVKLNGVINPYATEESFSGKIWRGPNSTIFSIEETTDRLYSTSSQQIYPGGAGSDIYRAYYGQMAGTPVPHISGRVIGWDLAPDGGHIVLIGYRTQQIIRSGNFEQQGAVNSRIALVIDGVTVWDKSWTGNHGVGQVVCGQGGMRYVTYDSGRLEIYSGSTLAQTINTEGGSGGAATVFACAKDYFLVSGFPLIDYRLKDRNLGPSSPGLCSRWLLSNDLKKQVPFIWRHDNYNSLDLDDADNYPYYQTYSQTNQPAAVISNLDAIDDAPDWSDFGEVGNLVSEHKYPSRLTVHPGPSPP